jgi:predicted dehydrogenase
MNTVRLGIIGLGNIGKFHAEYLLDNKINRCTLTAICDANPATLDKFSAQYSLKTFSDGEALIHSGEVDAVIIATPHFQHTSLGIAALNAGVHAMVEKPISSHKADALKLIAAHHENPAVIFAGMFQLRTEPRYIKIRDLVRNGDLGRIVRVNWINTDWYRTEAYYASGGWRATWKGEGGGVLLNQCLHNLDTLQWLCSMPTRVRGFCQLGLFHNVEVEDNVTTYLEWQADDGQIAATGSFVSSTGETPGTNRLEIAGSLGRIVLENDRLTFTRNHHDMLDLIKTSRQGFTKPESSTEEIPFENAKNPHATMVQNFVNAILDGEPLIVPGEEGINSVELANSIVYSSLIDRPVDLPLDANAWERKLNQLIADSTIQKKVIAPESTADFASSFRK